jgi:multiple sugar transport system substrate-binding protein
MMKRPTSLLSLFVAALMLASFAGLGRAQAQETITIWTKFNDQNTTDPNSQDKWMAEALKEFTATTKLAITNVVQPYDQINSKLNLAVQAGGDVPDLSYVDTLAVPFYQKNGTLQDITDYVKGSAWFKDIPANALAACTGTDGKIYCVPTSLAGASTYYWKSVFPNGFPKTAQELLAAGKELKKKDAKKYIVTFKGSEGISLGVTWEPLISSAGGKIVDDKGKAAWANDKVAAVVSWAREMFAANLVPAVSLAPGFDDETPFANGEAGAFLAGSWSYVYLNPLTAPDGTKFDFKSESIAKAADAGALGFAPPLAFGDGKPAMMISGTAYGIPVGAKNIKGAHAWIDWQMTAAQNAKFASAYGGIPTLNEALKDAAFQTGYWKAIAANLTTYGVNPPALVDYDKGVAALTNTINRLLLDPKLDIMKELQAAQDNYNNGL